MNSEQSSQDQDRALIERIIYEHARIPYSYGEIDKIEVFDRERDHYLLIIAGREQQRRVHSCRIHIDLIDGKFWVQGDSTEYGVAQELVDAGIPKDRIVLAFKSPEMRRYTEFAPA